MAEDDPKHFHFTDADLQAAKKEMDRLINADISQLSLGKQFEVTNERILRVRDDMTFVLNDKLNRLSSQIAGIGKALEVFYKQQEFALERIRHDNSLLEKQIAKLQTQVDRLPKAKKPKRKQLHGA